MMLLFYDLDALAGLGFSVRVLRIDQTQVALPGFAQGRILGKPCVNVSLACRDDAYAERFGHFAFFGSERMEAAH